MSKKVYINRSFEENMAYVKLEIDQALKKDKGLFSDVFEYLREVNGKNMRTALALTAGQRQDGSVSEDIIRLSAAIELLHLATLIHDDVIDDADTRRGKASLHKQFDKKTAIVTGDFLLTLCFELVSAKHYEEMQGFSRVISKICLGELFQLKNNKNLALTYRDYIKIISGKTAALFALSAYLGAVEAGFHEKTAKKIGIIGYKIGIIFQIVDDCLDYEDTGVTGKSNHIDLLEGVVTLPVVFAIRKNPEISNMITRDGEFFVEEGQVQAISQAIREAGGLKKTRQLIERFYKKTVKLIDRLPKECNKEGLMNYLKVAYERRK